MKLIFCKSCYDVRAMGHSGVQCLCGQSKGHYVNNLHAEVSGPCEVIGFSNASFVLALEDIPQAGMGRPFTAFFIPRECDTVMRV